MQDGNQKDICKQGRLACTVEETKKVRKIDLPQKRN